MRGRMPPYFVLDYQISIPGFKLQVDGVQKRMHAALFKYAQPDDMKLRSSMTLFATLSSPGSPFHAVLARYFSGALDERTLEFLANPTGAL